MDSIMLGIGLLVTTAWYIYSSKRRWSMSGETVLLSYSIFGVLAVTAFAIFLIKSEHEAMKEDEQD